MCKTLNADFCDIVEYLADANNCGLYDRNRELLKKIMLFEDDSRSICLMPLQMNCADDVDSQLSDKMNIRCGYIELLLYGSGQVKS